MNSKSALLLKFLLFSSSVVHSFDINPFHKVFFPRYYGAENPQGMRDIPNVIIEEVNESTELFLVPSNERNCIVMLLAGEGGFDASQSARYHDRYGCHFAFLEYRGHSPDLKDKKKAELKPLFSGIKKDFESAVKIAQEVFNCYGPLIVVGESMGGAFSLALAAKSEVKIDGIILETTFASAKSLNLSSFTKNLAKSGSTISSFYDLPLDPKANLISIGKTVKHPPALLILGGMNDTVMPVKDSIELFNAYCSSTLPSKFQIEEGLYNCQQNQPKVQMLLKNDGHLSFRNDPKNDEEIFTFLDSLTEEADELERVPENNAENGSSANVPPVPPNPNDSSLPKQEELKDNADDSDEGKESNEQDQVPKGNDQVPKGNDQVPNENDQVPNENDQVPNREDQIPNENDQVPNESDQVPKGNDQVPEGSDAALKVKVPVPNDVNQAEPVKKPEIGQKIITKSESIPKEEIAVPEEITVNQGNGTLPADNANPDDASKPSDNGGFTIHQSCLYFLISSVLVLLYC